MVQYGILLMVVVMQINRKKVVPPHSWGFVVESARRYECRSVQSAQECMMYLDTDAKNCNFNLVQYGICLMVVVMKINIKKVVPPIRGGLWWRVPGGTSADRY